MSFYPEKELIEVYYDNEGRQFKTDAGGFMSNLLSSYKNIGGQDAIFLGDVDNKPLDFKHLDTMDRIESFIDKIYYIDIKTEKAISFISELLDEREYCPVEGFKIGRYRFSDDDECIVSYEEEYAKFCEDWKISS